MLSFLNLSRAIFHHVTQFESSDTQNLLIARKFWLTWQPILLTSSSYALFLPLSLFHSISPTERDHCPYSTLPTIAAILYLYIAAALYFSWVLQLSPLIMMALLLLIESTYTNTLAVLEHLLSLYIPIYYRAREGGKECKRVCVCAKV